MESESEKKRLFIENEEMIKEASEKQLQSTQSVKLISYCCKLIIAGVFRIYLWKLYGNLKH
jgi:hypothetical protein